MPVVVHHSVSTHENSEWRNAKSHASCILFYGSLATEFHKGNESASADVFWFPFGTGILPRWWIYKSHSVPRAPSHPCLEDKGLQYMWKERLGGWDPHRCPVLKALSALDSTALTLEWGLATFKESVPRRGLCLPRESNCLTQGGVVLGTPENALLIFCHFNKLGS